MTDKVVSIIIPYHAEGQWLITRALMSINNQVGINKEQIEVIVVGDGGLRLRLQDLHRMMPDLPFEYLYSGQTGGTGVARQRGVEVASGKFITFLDAEDELYSDVVLREFMDVCGEHEIIVGRIEEQMMQDNGPLYLVERDFEEHNVGGKWFNRDFLQHYELNWRDDLQVYDDMYFLGMAFKLAEDVYQLDEPVYAWLWREKTKIRKQNSDAVLRRLDQWDLAMMASLEKIGLYRPDELSECFLTYMADIYLRSIKYPANDPKKFRAQHAALVLEFAKLWPQTKLEIGDAVHKMVVKPGVFHNITEAALPRFIADQDLIIKKGASA